MLGAHGALMGTRFYASTEALAAKAAKRRITAALGLGTVRTRVFDLVRGYTWPTGHTGRALVNGFTERWHGQEWALIDALDGERKAYQSALEQADCNTTAVWAGECVDLVSHIEDAGAILARIGQEAEQQLTLGARLVR